MLSTYRFLYIDTEKYEWSSSDSYYYSSTSSNSLRVRSCMRGVSSSISNDDASVVRGVNGDRVSD